MQSHHLTYGERCQIAALLGRGISKSEIARVIGVHRSTIGRELERNTCGSGYHMNAAQGKADTRKRLTRKEPRKMTPEAVRFIEDKLKEGWSPQQISGWLKRRQDRLPAVSHERIYQHVWKDKRRGGKLYLWLRHRGRKYARRGALHEKRGQIKGRVDIDARPAVVERKSRLGDWELDTIIGARHRGAIVSMVERKSKLVRLALVPSRKADEVTAAIAASLKADRRKVLTLTMDNGKEFAGHLSFGRALQADTFFAKPYQAWQRGLNEHSNGLVRQYFPKSTGFCKVTHAEVREVEQRLNNRPRAVLGFKTPREVFYAA